VVIIIHYVLAMAESAIIQMMSELGRLMEEANGIVLEKDLIGS
jgi:hypothetical protein